MKDTKTLLPRKLQAKQTKEHIIKVTMQLAKEEGIDGFTLRDICRAADVSIGNFYHYFKSKDDVILYTRHPYAKHILSEIKKINNDDFVQLLLEIYEARANFIANSPLEESSIIIMMNLKYFKDNNYIEDNIVDSYILDIIKDALENSKITSNFDALEILTMINSVHHGCSNDFVCNNGNYDLIKNSSFILKALLNELIVRN